MMSGIFRPKPGKIDIEFDRELDEIIRDRYGRKMDKRPVSRALVQRKITKHPLWPNLKMDLKRLNFIPENKIMNKKGQIAGWHPTFNLFTLIVVSVLAVVLFAGLQYSMNLINNVMMQVGAQNEANAGNVGYTNMTYAAQVTFGKVNASMDGLRLVSMALIFSIILGILFTNFLMKVHPAFFLIYIFIVLLAVIFAVPVSNAYLSLIQSGVFGGYLQQHAFANFIILRLPFVTALVGIAGAVLLFVNIVRSQDEGPL